MVSWAATDAEPPLALVTGSTRGLGRIVAGALRQARLRVAVHGRAAEQVRAVAAEVEAIPVVADLTQPGAISAAIDTLIADHGRVDVLINNAAAGGPFGHAWQVDADDWWQTAQTNIRGTYEASTAVLPAMLAARRGRIINVVSHAGIARWPGASAYAVSKAAVIKIGENLAAETRGTGVSVLNVHPGILEIGLAADLLASDPPSGSVEADLAAWLRRKIADGWTVGPDVAAALLVRLARGDADRLSGCYLTPDDDLDALIARAHDPRVRQAHRLGLVGEAAS